MRKGAHLGGLNVGKITDRKKGERELRTLENAFRHAREKEAKAEEMPVGLQAQRIPGEKSPIWPS